MQYKFTDNCLLVKNDNGYSRTPITEIKCICQEGPNIYIYLETDAGWVHNFQTEEKALEAVKTITEYIYDQL